MRDVLYFGLLTGIADFFGAFMNMNYLLAGMASTNPHMRFLATFLVLAWRVNTRLSFSSLLVTFRYARCG